MKRGRTRCRFPGGRQALSTMPAGSGSPMLEPWPPLPPFFAASRSCSSASRSSRSPPPSRPRAPGRPAGQGCGRGQRLQPSRTSSSFRARRGPPRGGLVRDRAGRREHRARAAQRGRRLVHLPEHGGPRRVPDRDRACGRDGDRAERRRLPVAPRSTRVRCRRRPAAGRPRPAAHGRRGAGPAAPRRSRRGRARSPRRPSSSERASPAPAGPSGRRPLRHAGRRRTRRQLSPSAFAARRSRGIRALSGSTSVTPSSWSASARTASCEQLAA